MTTIYIVVVDFHSGKDSRIAGVYKNYQDAYQTEQSLLYAAKHIFDEDIKIRIIGPYKQYDTAYQEERKLKKIVKTLFWDDN